MGRNSAERVMWEVGWSLKSEVGGRKQMAVGRELGAFHALSET